MDKDTAAFDARGEFDAIERQRGQIGLSRAELTRAADINEATYTRLMQDPARVPHRRTVIRLKAALARLALKVAGGE